MEDQTVVENPEVAATLKAEVDDGDKGAVEVAKQGEADGNVEIGEQVIAEEVKEIKIDESVVESVESSLPVSEEVVVEEATAETDGAVAAVEAVLEAVAGNAGGEIGELVQIAERSLPTVVPSIEHEALSSPSSWWNCCGLLEVIMGSKDDASKK